jgi:SpoVK/Ycf46/Vps4 family AAA+-type ATPase
LSTASFPAWARDLADRYMSGSSCLFILSGNVNDWVPLREPNKTSFVSLSDFLRDALFGQRDAVVLYDQGSGITVSPDAVQDFYKAVEAMDTVAGTSYAKKPPKNPSEALLVIDRFIRSRALDSKKKASVAVVISFAHMVAPRGDLQFMNQEDFRTLITVQKWATDPLFAKSDVTIVLVTGSLQDLNEAIVNNPFTAKVEIGLPDEAERRDFIAGCNIPVKYEGVTEEVFARQTNALSRVDISVILREAQRLGRLDAGLLSRKKKELIEKSCFGLLEFLEPDRTLDDVQGQEGAKKRLREDISLIKKGAWDALPMGYLFCGPVGTGKTYLATCAIGELGVPCVQLLNFRSKWVGATEGNLEKILLTLRALGPVGVLIDEADAFMGDRDQGGDSGTSNRTFAQFATQMGDTRYRGKILWILMTCRPDLLPVDIKRQGRVEIHIPLFYPSDAEKPRYFVAMSKKAGWPVVEGDVDPKWLAGKKVSGADIEAIIVAAKRQSLLDGGAAPKKSYLEKAASDFIPVTSSLEVQYQELASVLECTDRSFLPDEYRKADRAEVMKEFHRLKALLES